MFVPPSRAAHFTNFEKVRGNGKLRTSARHHDTNFGIGTLGS
jgi:hypothetical protein